MFGIGGERDKEWVAFESEPMLLIEDVFRVVKWLQRDCEEAEDLKQKTFAQASKSFDRYILRAEKNRGDF